MAEPTVRTGWMERPSKRPRTGGAGAEGRGRRAQLHHAQAARGRGRAGARRRRGQLRARAAGRAVGREPAPGAPSHADGGRRRRLAGSRHRRHHGLHRGRLPRDGDLAHRCALSHRRERKLYNGFRSDVRANGARRGRSWGRGWDVAAACYRHAALRGAPWLERASGSSRGLDRAEAGPGCGGRGRPVRVATGRTHAGRARAWHQKSRAGGARHRCVLGTS